MTGSAADDHAPADECRIMVYKARPFLFNRPFAGSIPALRLIPPPPPSVGGGALLSPLSQTVDADPCLSLLPQVKPAEEPDYKGLESAMRKAWDTPLVQWHMEYNMERIELLHVWRSGATHSPRSCTASFVCRQSPRAHRTSSTHAAASKQEASGVTPAAGSGTNSSIHPSSSPTPAHSGQISNEAAKCFLEFQALGTQLLTMQVLLEEKVDSFLTGIRDSTLVERAGAALERLVQEAAAIRDYCRAVHARWVSKEEKVVLDVDEHRNALCFKGLERLAKAAVYAHREMEAFVSCATSKALKELEKADKAAAEGQRARGLRTAAVKTVAADDIIPYEVYLLFSPPTFPFNSFASRRQRKRPLPSDRARQLHPEAAASAPHTPRKREAEEDEQGPSKWPCRTAPESPRNGQS
ncbi:hypothetical protein Emed_004558 [Eimeria media]